MEQIKEYCLDYGDYRLKFLNIGAVITEYSYKGNNVVLSFENLESYRNNYTNLGSIVGRSAGRIRDGKLEGWTLPLNQDGKHTLHGGRKFQYKFYNVYVIDNVAKLILVDPEGDFPGNALCTITFQLDENGLTQVIDSVADKPTILNFTNHSYFNLGQDSILEHKLCISSDAVLELDEDLLPVGTIDVSETAFDFNEPKQIGKAKEQGHDQFKYSKFIDHPYKLKDDKTIILSNDSLKLEITTDQDYLVVYGGNYIGDEQNKLRNDMNKDYHAICLETQAAPGTTDLVTEYKAITNYKITST